MAIRRVLPLVMSLALVGGLLLPAAEAGKRSRARAAAHRASRPAPPQEPVYDPAREITLEGTVDEVMDQTMLSRSDLQRIVLATGDGPVLIQLAPSSFLKSQDFRCLHGDEVSITGSRVDGPLTSLVLARSVTKGDRTLILRDDEGRPEWIKVLREARFNAAAGN